MRVIGFADADEGKGRSVLASVSEELAVGVGAPLRFDLDEEERDIEVGEGYVNVATIARKLLLEPEPQFLVIRVEEA